MGSDEPPAVAAGPLCGTLLWPRKGIAAIGPLALNQSPLGTASPRWQVQQVTPVSPTCFFQSVLIFRVISIMRRATTLGYFSSDSSLSGLWQKSQPSSGETQVVKACITRENSVALRSLSTLTFSNTSLAGGASTSAGSSGGRDAVQLGQCSHRRRDAVIWICPVPAGPPCTDWLRSQPASSAATANAASPAQRASATPAMPWNPIRTLIIGTSDLVFSCGCGAGIRLPCAA